jgi:hypothetical protein
VSGDVRRFIKLLAEAFLVGRREFTGSLVVELHFYQGGLRRVATEARESFDAKELLL